LLSDRPVFDRVGQCRLHAPLHTSPRNHGADPFTRDEYYPISLSSIPAKGKPFRAEYYGLGTRGKEGSTDLEYTLWLLDASGKRVKLIHKAQSLHMPQLSPNGLLVCATNSSGHLVVLYTTGNKVFDIGRFGGEKHWSPDSKKIFFITTIEDGERILGGDLYVFSLETGETTRITRSEFVPEYLDDVSPDGNKVAVIAVDGNRVTVEVYYVGGE